MVLNSSLNSDASTRKYQSPLTYIALYLNRDNTYLQLTYLSIFLWVLSLLFTALTTYYGNHNLTGLDILYTGWAGPLVLNFAWYANLTFGISVTILLSGKAAPILSFTSVLLASNTFFFDKIPSSTTAIYGYGLGFFFWGTAILTCLIASISRDRKLRKNRVSNFATFISILPLTLFLIYIFYNTASDHMTAANFERDRLSKSLFKKGAICKSEIIQPETILPSTTPLEIIDLGGYTQTEFRKPEKLLKHGVSRLRIDGIEYKLTPTDGTSTIKKSSYSNTKSATLIIQSDNTKVSKHPKWKAYIDSNIDNQRYKKLTLIAPDKSIIFEQKWIKDKKHHYCPRYYSAGGKLQSDIQLILDSLNL
ncbi:hypothetical protein ACJJIL_17400 [Microbulbifer sp. EKSA005]|uniref:hypothetical protein n=1 Tax=Microbulbifer sp. EKSA005 TaxID=3243364 RepID=UPI00404211E1